MIYDTNSNPINRFAYAQAKSTAKTMQILVDCKTGYRLFCDVTANVTVEGKVTGGVSFTDLEASFIDLSPYDGMRKSFDIRVTTANVGRVRVDAKLRVEKS
jgi:hypothetical protein